MSRIKYVRAPEEAILACAHPVPVPGSLEKYSTAFSAFFTQDLLGLVKTEFIRTKVLFLLFLRNFA